MIDRKISVHLQDFPEYDFLPQDLDLLGKMELVREICSMALFIRDQHNLRVRLPLKSLTIIGRDAKNILKYNEIIADEINVKEVLAESEIASFAQFKLQINFKKVGGKFGEKMKEITAAAKEGRWKKISEREVEICGLTLLDDEFEIKLSINEFDQQKFAICALEKYNYLICLDIEKNEKLELEGLARDLIRAIQQDRKSANLDISDHISVNVFCVNEEFVNRIKAAIKEFGEYIKEQVLAVSIDIVSSSISLESSFQNKIEDEVIEVTILR